MSGLGKKQYLLYKSIESPLSDPTLFPSATRTNVSKLPTVIW